MHVKLFDIQNGVVIPSEHCYILKSLKDIIDNYPEEYMKIFMYLFYMHCMNPEINTMMHLHEDEKEAIMMKEISGTFNTDDALIMIANTSVAKMYATPTSRAYKGIKGMLDRLASFMETTALSDDNINSLVNAAAKYEAIRQSYKGTYKDLLEEQKSKTKGDQNLGYDQQ